VIPITQAFARDTRRAFRCPAPPALHRPDAPRCCASGSLRSSSSPCSPVRPHGRKTLPRAGSTSSARSSISRSSGPTTIGEHEAWPTSISRSRSARFDASLERFQTRPDHLAAPLVAQAGPGLRFDRHIQSRVSLTRPLAEGVELEVVWETRNRVESGDPMAFGRQIVGAMIRITL